MRNHIKILTYLSIVMMISAVFLFGCSEQGETTSPMQAGLTEPPDMEDQSQKKIIERSFNTDIIEPADPEYPQSISCLAYFKNAKDYYNGSACELPNRSSFEFQNGSLIPPSDHPWGETVIITMEADLDPVSNEIIYTFGPSGCTFDIPAEVWLDWKDLGSANARLFYLDDEGNRIEELPEQIDIYNKQMCIRINHFSRYAVAYSN